MTARTWEGAKLSEIRLSRGLSQDQLAWKAQTSVTNISRWERNKNVPSGNAVANLAHALGVDEASFFNTNGGDPEEDDEEAEHLRQAFDDLYAAVLKFSRPREVRTP